MTILTPHNLLALGLAADSGFFPLNYLRDFLQVGEGLKTSVDIGGLATKFISICLVGFKELSAYIEIRSNDGDGPNIQMELDLAKLVNNNDPPFETTIHKVKELLVAPLQDLADTESEIVHLEARIKFLKERCDKIQQSIDKYRMILSPVRRLPTDILHEIFSHCLPTHRNPILSASEAPVLLTRVCSPWRSIALSSPRLWAQLHITFSDDYRVMHLRVRGSNGTTGLVDGNAAIRPCAQRTLKLRCDAVKKWLGRSGTCPLSLSISYSSHASRVEHLESDLEQDLTFELFNTIVLFSHRWRSLELTMSIEVYRRLESMIPISGDTLPALASLKMNLYQQVALATPGIGMIVPEPIALFKAPHLQRVSLNGPASQSAFWRLDTVPFNLTYLCCHSWVTALDAFTVLKQCRNLIHCKLSIASDRVAAGIQSTQNPVDTPRWLNVVAFLPYLRSFSIHEYRTTDASMNHFYSSIDAPHLKWIDYQKQGPYQVNEILDTNIPFPIFPLLQKAAELRKLVIDPRAFSSANFHTALGLASPTLTHLVLGKEPVVSSKFMPDAIPTSRYSSLNRRAMPLSPFDLEWLIVQDQGLGSSPGGNTSILLPHLEIFEWSLGTVSDDLLLRFITGRMDPSSQRGVAMLKHVRIAFDTVKSDRDVIEEVAQYRDSSSKNAKNGVPLGEVNLEFHYLTQRLIKDGAQDIEARLSPSHGLVKNGRSWGYPDIDDSMVPK